MGHDRIQEHPPQRILARLQKASRETGQSVWTLWQLELELRIQRSVERLKARRLAAGERKRQWRAKQRAAEPARAEAQLQERLEKATAAKFRLGEPGKKGRRRRHRAKSHASKLARAEQQRRRRARVKEARLADKRAALALAMERALAPEAAPKYKIIGVGEAARIEERESNE